MRRLLCLLICTTSLAMAAAVPAGFQFLDDQMASRAGHDTHGRVFVYFCGHCPRAREWMHGEIKALNDAIAATNAPLELVCATPELQGQSLEGYITAAGLDHAAVAYDAENRKNISTKNIYQVDFVPGVGGKQFRISFGNIGDLTAIAKDPARHGELGSYRYDPSAITDERVKALWAAVEFDQAQAIRQLAAVRKKAKEDDPIGAEIIALYEAVNTTCMDRINGLVGGEQTFATYEALEAALRAADGLDTKEAVKHLKGMAKDKTIKTELQARAIYQQCQALLASNKSKDHDKAASGLAMLKQRYPETVYGKLVGD